MKDAKIKYGSKGNNPEHNKKYWLSQLPKDAKSKALSDKKENKPHDFHPITYSGVGKGICLVCHKHKDDHK